MVRILHTSDWHIGRRIGGRDRSDEHRTVLAEITGIADANSVDLILVAGDVFDSSAPSPQAEEIAWSALLAMAEVAPVLVVGGNHDNERRLDAVAPLLAMGRITTVGAPRAPGDGGLVHIEDLGTKVAMLPFVSQRGIVKAAQIMSEDPDRHAGDYAQRLRAVIEALTREMTDETVNVLMSHLTVYGALAGGGERTAHIFGYAIPASLFPGGLSYVALGHLHRQQKMPHAASVWYSGSPLQLDFGEVADRKGVLVVEAAPGLPSSVTSVPLSSGTRLATLRGTLAEVLERADEVEGAFVKVELEEKARVGLADEVRAAIPGVVDVVLQGHQPPEKTLVQRQSLDPIEAFGRYLSDRGTEDPRLETLFAELLEEATT
ncbi:MAG: exonuclease SbcCD subunit D [Acidimicrobiia bacterium]|nr:exonuclease SbcCD subunit D [Acidimicrobiia bacterium]